MKTIASRQNVWFKRARAALREHRQEIVIEGPKQVSDAIAAGWKPIAVITKGAAGLELETSGEIIEFSSELFDALSETNTPQDVIALFERPKGRLADLVARVDSIVVALDGVQDPGNVGTVVRLAAAFDCAGVALLPGCADPFSPKAIRASVGAALSVPVAGATADDLLDSGLPLYAADTRGRASDPPVRRAILVFGSEGGGVSDPIKARATAIAIPMSSRVESLNVAASAAILLSRSYQLRSS